MKRILLTIAALLAASPVFAQVTPYATSWQSVGKGVAMDSDAPNRQLVTYRQIGTATAGDTGDDTQTVHFTDCNGNPQTAQSAPWQTLDLTSFGVPTAAGQVYLNFKAVISKGTHDGDVAVYAWVRRPGSAYGRGPINAPQFPVPFCLPPGITVVQPIMESTAHVAVDTRREFAQVWAPATNGQIEWAWGYIRTVPGNWPDGDAIAIDLYLNGYAQP